jgi:hypothetical protein
VPKTDVVFFQDDMGRAPVLEWLAELRLRDPRAAANCVARIVRLAQAGYELRRPEADSLRGGIHELRARHGHVNYRILYAFVGRNVAILLHALTKEGSVPDAEIARATERWQLATTNPRAHIREDLS